MMRESQVRGLDVVEAVRFLSEAADVLSSSLDQGRIVAGFANVAVRRFSDGCAIVFADDGELRLGAVDGKHSSAVARIVQNGHVQQVVSTRETLMRNDIDDRYVQALIVAPMMVAGRLTGTVSFTLSDRSRQFAAADVDVAVAAARQLAVGLENVRSFDRFRFLAHATDLLFAASDMPAKLRNVLAALVEEVADWAAIYVLGPQSSIRLEEVVHRDPEKTAILSEARGQRVFNRDSERSFHDTLSKHRSMLRTSTGIDRLRETLQPYLVPIYSEATPHSMLTVPLFTTEAVYGALTLYATSRNFGHSELELTEELARRVALAFEHEGSLERERRLTQTLQEVTLPAQLPRIPGVEISTVYVPATTSDAQVGGDWYDIFELPDGRYLLSIGDVTGRGLQASAIMGKLRHSINVIAMYEDDPAKILDAAEKVVQQRYPDAIATTFVVTYDPRTARLRAANAGHPHPILRMRDGSLETLVAEGLPIGLRSMSSPSQPVSRSLDGVASMAFYTDGIVEGSHEILVGEERLYRAFSSEAIPFVRSPARLIAALCLPAIAQDDAAILVINFPRATWTFQADHARAANDARHAFVDHLGTEGVDPHGLYAAEAIFGELVANVVRHAPGPIDVALEWIENVATLHVTDRGGGFKYQARKRADILMEAGRGLWLIEQFGGVLDIERIPGYGTHIRVALPVARTLA